MHRAGREGIIKRYSTEPKGLRWTLQTRHRTICDGASRRPIHHNAL